MIFFNNFRCLAIGIGRYTADGTGCKIKGGRLAAVPSVPVKL